MPRRCRGRRRIGRTVGSTLLTWLAACGPPAQPNGPSPLASDGCRLPNSPTAVVPDTVVVVVPGPLGSPSLPPDSDADRVVARQLYLPLIRVDCRGELRPSLAGRWWSDSGGRVWRFELIEGLRFADGSALDAAAVVASWRRTGFAAGGVGGGRLDAVEDATVLSASALNARTVRVGFSAAVASPRGLADVRMGVGGPPGPDGRPAESGRFRLGPSRSDGVAILEPRTAGTVVRVVGLPPNADPRDRLAGSRPADVLLTRDLATIRFAAARGFEVTPLPWDRTYDLVTAPGLTPPTAPAAAELEALAALAVRADARPATTSSGCPGSSAAGPTPRGGVAYRSDDPIGRDLAERIAALTGLAAPPRWLAATVGARSAGWPAVPLTAAALERAVTGSTPAAVPDRARPGSTTTAAIVSRASAAAVACPAAGPARLPLIESRATVIRTAMPVGLLLEADGGIWLEPRP